jgi:flavin-dependent dehydrogenase
MRVGSADHDVDVFIAGAGPAGLACAIAAAAQGLRVEVADGMRPPIDKACGEGLLPDTLAALTELGVTLDGTESFPLRGIRFLGDSGDRHATESEALFPTAPGRGVRRTLLHQLLLDRATSLGVHFRWETVVQSIDNAQVRTNRHTVYPRWIIGADGHQSRIRAWAGLEKSSTSARRIGLRQHFVIAPWTDLVEVYWTNHAQAYITPVSPTEVCVAFIATEKFTSIQQAMELFPALQLRLASAPASDSPRGSITVSRKLRKVTSGNIALIGDASGSVDAVTGEGLALCFRQALALASALKAEDLTEYERVHRKIHRLPHLMSRTMLLMDRSTVIRFKALETLQRRPDLFSHLLQIHIGNAPLRLLGNSGILASALFFLASG